MASTLEQCESKPLGSLSNTLNMFDTFKSHQNEDKDSDEESFHLPMLGCDDDMDGAKDPSEAASPSLETEDEILNKFETGVPDVDVKLDEGLLDEDIEEKGERKEKEMVQNPEMENSNENNIHNNIAKKSLLSEDEEDFLDFTVIDDVDDNTQPESDNVENCNKQSENSDNSEEKENIEQKDDEGNSVNNDQMEQQDEEVNSVNNDKMELQDEENNEANKENIEQDEEDKKNKEQQDKDSVEQTTENLEEQYNTESDNVENKEEDLKYNTDDSKIEQEEKEPEKNISNFETDTLEDTNENTTEDNSMDTNKAVEVDSPEEAENPETEPKEKDISLECDDLLDISIIRDADEDNASAIAEITETQSSEKSDNDDQEDTLVSADRDDAMEYDENTNSCDRESSSTENVNDLTNDSENKENEISSDIDNQNPQIDDITENTSNQSCVENKEEEKDQEKISAVPIETEEELPEEIPETIATPGTKRSCNDTEQVTAKKMRLSIESDELKNETTTGDIKNLVNLKEFMKNRDLGIDKLTRSDLEQFCIQKICEVIIHKTEVGDLHQNIKKLEQTIDNLRKDMQQLNKQSRDLEIVNRKLMGEIRTQTGNQKPLVPLKITRSVGLQVKLNLGNEQNMRRKSVNSPRTPVTPNNNIAATLPVRRSLPATNSVIRQVVPTSSPSIIQRKPPSQAPILTQALQTRPTPSPAQISTQPGNKRSTPIRSKTTESPKPSAPGVIDLTDEDERITKTANAQKTMLNKSINGSVKMVNKPVGAKSVGVKMNNGISSQKTVTINQTKSPTKISLQPRTATSLPQGIRLTTTPVKNGITLPAGVVTSTAGGATQLMYVVQQGATAGGPQKAVFVNFQATNGVIPSTINGSAVSVIPSKTSNTVQLKTITARKHPAPLPLPPPSIINNSLKPLLPKPHLSIRKTDTGIILQWRMPYNLDIYEGIASYQLFAYQETSAAPSTDMWRKVGDVKALALPMACTLTQFADKNKYYFAVRSVDIYKRIGAFSDPEEISL